jgi:D-alanyl-D-alanine carboxypeptidase/D-alanyl-D-alanine-endopeptidase (penicillin-binding protein 4)
MNTEWRSPVGATLPTSGININHNYVIKTRRSISNPARYAGEQLYHALKKLGVSIAPTIVIKKIIHHTVLALHASAPLNELIAVVLKDSDNLYSDCIFKAIGAHTSKQPGTWLNAQQAITQFLVQTAHLDSCDFFIADGSGLSRKNKCTPHQFILLLMWAYNHFMYFNELFNGLPKAGTDGTLKGRINNPLIYAKTGTLKGISSLVGYCTHTTQEPIVFAIMAQGPSGMAHKKTIEDHIAKAVAKYHVPHKR